MARKVLLLVALLAHVVCAQTSGGRTVVQAELIANTGAIVPGQDFKVGLLLRMEPGWHTYWQNPGDSGMATMLKWDLPAGLVAGDIQWPTPAVTLEEGDLLTYTYAKEVLLVVPVKVAAGISAEKITLKAKASWLACKEMCLPGEADVSLTLPVDQEAGPANEELFRRYESQIPQPIEASGFKVVSTIQGKTISVELGNVPTKEKLELFPLLSGSETFGRVKVDPPADGKWRFTYESEKSPVTSAKAVLALGDAPETRKSWLVEIHGDQRAGSRPDWMLFAFGFLGGLILNIMPCVLPVIALKILGFVHQAGQSPRRVLMFGLSFVAGIFAWFLGLAAFLTIMKAAGQQVNWAFQFQNPMFVLVMCLIVLIFALNLLGAFELMLPAGANARITQIASQEGCWGAFLHGVFATLLATPCTAPFLAPALGFALGQRGTVIFAMFATVAAGMSLPYLLLTARPSWLSYLPKPGIWMVRVKQAMGVILLGTALWLGWIYYKQTGSRSGESFTAQLENALATKRHVFVDFTADWCINCKVNERLVLHSEPVQKAFKDNDVLFLKADWTRGDEDITRFLKSYGRAGVPFYIVFPANDRANPKVLPELLTRDIVIRTLSDLRAN